MRSPFARWLVSGKETPTTEKYFTAANRDLIGSAFPPSRSTRGRPYRRLGTHLFTAGKNALLLRHATERELNILKKGNFSRIIYMQDDDLESIIHDPYINMEYRKRTEKFIKGFYQDICRLATDIVSPSPTIMEQYGNFHAHFLGPSMLSEPEDMSHHDYDKQFRIVFLGTRSHLQDLNLITAELADFLKNRKYSARLDTFLGKWAPPALKNLKNAHHYAPSGWMHFRRILASQRWHLALAPMRPTPTNRGRSWNKLLDHAAVGAATLHSAGACPMLDLATGGGKHGLPVDSVPGRWREILEWLASDRAMTKRLAEAGLHRARKIGNPQDTRLFWRKLLLT